MGLKLLLIFSLSILTILVKSNDDDDEVIKHLETYGYLNSSEYSLTGFEEALMLFQERYNLNVTGEVTRELINFIKTPRCSLSDSDESAFTLFPGKPKWNKRTIIWYSLRREIEIVAAKAFSEWQKVANITFVFSYKNPDIVISFGKGKHRNSLRCARGTCGFSFDGEGNTLAHALYPDQNNNCKEIHLDQEENWYFGFDIPKDSNKISLYPVLLHEIGHTLGLAHSSNINAVMYPYFRANNITLSYDDILAIQYLYGLPTNPIIPKTSKPTPPPPTTTTTSKPKKLEENPLPEPNLIDLCQIEYPEQMLVTNNNHLYIFYKGLVWILKIGEPSGLNLKRPRKTSEYIGAYNNFSHIYQKPDGRIVLIDKSSFNTYYFPNLAYESFNKSIDNFGIPKNSKINGIFNSNWGKTYILYDDWYFGELDECSLKTINHGLIKERFPGIPLDITSAFRYINGNIYFFKKDIYYEFSEFSGKLLRAGPFDWSLFDINCPNETILNQLKNILTTLSKYFDN